MEDPLPLMGDNLLGGMVAHIILIQARVQRGAMLKGMKVVMGGVMTTDTGEGEVVTKSITALRESEPVRTERGLKKEKDGES